VGEEGGPRCCPAGADGGWVTGPGAAAAAEP
jgi:hypothetical protein